MDFLNLGGSASGNALYEGVDSLCVICRDYLGKNGVKQAKGNAKIAKAGMVVTGRSLQHFVILRYFCQVS